MNFKKFLALVCSFLMLVSCFGINSKAMEEEPLKFKVLLVGDAEAGKTQIWNRFAEYEYNRKDECYQEFYSPSGGMDYFTVTKCNFNEKPIHLQVWDTAGQECKRYFNMLKTKTLLRNCHAIILCIDLTGKDFKTQYETWMNEANKYVGDAAKDENGKLKAPIILVGTKYDLVNDDKKQQFKNFANDKNHDYFISSAKNDYVENSKGKSIEFDGFGQALCGICLEQYEEESKGKKTKSGCSTGKKAAVGVGVGAIGTLATIFGRNHHKNKNKTKVQKAQKVQSQKAKVATVA